MNKKRYSKNQNNSRKHNFKAVKNIKSTKKRYTVRRIFKRPQED